MCFCCLQFKFQDMGSCSTTFSFWLYETGISRRSVSAQHPVPTAIYKLQTCAIKNEKYSYVPGNFYYTMERGNIFHGLRGTLLGSRYLHGQVNSIFTHCTGSVFKGRKWSPYHQGSFIFAIIMWLLFCFPCMPLSRLIMHWNDGL